MGSLKFLISRFNLDLDNSPAHISSSSDRSNFAMMNKALESVQYKYLNPTSERYGTLKFCSSFDNKVLKTLLQYSFSLMSSQNRNTHPQAIL